MHRFSNDDRRRRLVVRHRLLTELRCDTATSVANTLLAVHSSDPTTVFLSIAARMRGAAVDAIEADLYDQRSLVRHHAFRRTLWVMEPEIARAAHAAAGVKVAAAERRKLLHIVAASPETGCSTIADAEHWCRTALEAMRSFISEGGPATTREIGRQFPEFTTKLTLGAGTKHAGQAAAHTRILQLAGFEADLTRTSPVNGWNTAEYAWSNTSDWFGEPLSGAPVAESEAFILDAWLQRFGPATETDIKWWTGWTVKQMRAALDAVEAEPVLVEGGQPAWIAAGDIEVPDGASSVVVLPGLDATTMGWKERDWYLSPRAAERTFDRWMNAGPTIWRDGEVVGGWVQRGDGSVAVELFAELSAGEQRMLDDEIDRYLQFVGDVTVKLRFPSANQKDLLA